MKTIKECITRAVAKVGLCVGLATAALLGSAPEAEAGVGQNTRWGMFTNSTTLQSSNTVGNVALLVAGSGTGTVATTNVPVYAHVGMAFLPLFALTNAGTETATFNFNVTHDGTNWTTTNPIAIVMSCNGTTGVRGYTNIPPAALDNVQGIRLSSIANGHASSLFVTNVVWETYP